MRRYKQKFDYAARMVLPALLTLVLFLLTLLPIGIPGFASFPPDMCLIGIYYWTIFRSAVMPPLFLFVLGIIRDALLGNALGISSLFFLLFRLAVQSQHRYLVRETFIATWVSFGLLAFSAQTFFWLLASMYAKTILPIEAFVMQCLFTFGFYPLLHLLFGRVYSFLPREI